jgi:hypothetical protein
VGHACRVVRRLRARGARLACARARHRGRLGSASSA